MGVLGLLEVKSFCYEAEEATACDVVTSVWGMIHEKHEKRKGIYYQSHSTIPLFYHSTIPLYYHSTT